MLSFLGTALGISLHEDDASAGVVGAVEKSARTVHADLSGNATDSGERHFDLAAIKRQVPKNIQNNDIFLSKSWYVPPVQAAQVVSQQASITPPPPPPSAPPMPFTFVGRMVDGNEVTLFLLRNGQQYTVKKGETLDATYRVDEITSTEAALTHIPTNTRQALVFNSAAAAISAPGAPVATQTAQAVPELRRPIELVPLSN